MKTLKLTLAIILLLGIGLVIWNIKGYYSGHSLADEVEQQRAQLKLKREAKGKSRKANQSKTSPKNVKPSTTRTAIDLNTFYQNITLTPEQRTKAEAIVETLNQTQKETRSLITDLQSNTKVALWDCLDGAKKAGMNMDEIMKSTLSDFYQKQILPNIDAQKKNDAEKIFQDYLAKSAELNQSLRKQKQTATTQLEELLTSDQKQNLNRTQTVLPKSTQEKKKKSKSAKPVVSPAI